MKTVLNGIKYNLKNYFVAWFIFSFVWLLFSSILLYYSSLNSYLENSHSVKAELEKSLKTQDLINLKEGLWKLKSQNIKRVTFYPNEDFSMINESLTIGENSKYSWLELKRPYFLVLNGLLLGKAIAHVNLFELLRSSFWDNLGLFIFMAVFFVLLTLYANNRTAKAIYNIESKIELVNVGNTADLESVLAEVSEKSWSALSGFKDFIYKYLRLSEEKVALDMELHDFEYRYKLAREVAHGIKSPVHTLNVLNKKFSSKMTESEKKLFNMACERINFHANEILTQNNENKRLSVVNVSNAIQKLISMKQNEFKKYKDIEIIYQDFSNETLSLPVQSIYEILSNLINNAFDAIEGDKGTIRVSSRIKENMLIIECEDSGKGIPQAIIEKIWEDDFSYEKKHGSGIGLSMIKDLVESKWNGKCLVESNIGIGSRFELQIPVS